MGGKGGGGGFNTSGLAAAQKKATELQKEIWGMTREDVEPWYNMGTGAVSKLSDLLGIGGGSVLTRDQLYDQMKDQYTSDSRTAGSGAGYAGLPYELRNFDIEGYLQRPHAQENEQAAIDYMMGLYDQYGKNNESAFKDRELFNIILTNNYTENPLQKTQSITDFEGLNKAVDEAYANQQTPEDYGSLLKRFGMEDFEEDPAYKFRMEEAQNALERKLAAQGVTLGGGGYGELQPQAYRYMNELTQGLASEEYGKARDRYVQDQLNTFNMLMGSAGMGQQSTQIMANAGTNYVNAASQGITDLASAQMNAQLAKASQPSGFQQMLGTAVGIGSLFL